MLQTTFAPRILEINGFINCLTEKNHLANCFLSLLVLLVCIILEQNLRGPQVNLTSWNDILNGVVCW